MNRSIPIVVFILILSLIFFSPNPAFPRDKHKKEKDSSSLPTNPYEYYQKGREKFLLLAPLDLLDSIELYKKALELDNTFAPAYAGLAEAYSSLAFLNLEEKEEFEDLFIAASEYIQKALSLKPQSLETQRALALNYLHLRRKADARVAAQRALELSPDDPQSLYIVWESNGANPDDPLIHKVLEIDPNLVMAYIGIGKAYFYKSRDYAASTLYFGKATQVSPRMDYAFNLLGTALRTQGNIRGAIKSYDKAIEINPKSASAYMNLGISYFYAGGVDDCIKNEQAAITLNANFPDSFYYLARCSELAGNLEEAKKNYSRFIELTSKEESYASMVLEARASLMKLGNTSY